jgi:hypothetical protein
VPSVDIYSEFRTEIVEADFREFMAAKGSLRKAWHCAGSLFHLHDWVYAAHKAAIDAKYTYVDDHGQTKPVSKSEHFANALGQAHNDFQLVRGIANASKHFALRTPPAGRQNPPGMPSHAANTYVVGVGFQPRGFQKNAFQMQGNVMLQAQPNDIAFADIAQSVLGMWDRLFAAEAW